MDLRKVSDHFYDLTKRLNVRVTSVLMASRHENTAYVDFLTDNAGVERLAGYASSSIIKLKTQALHPMAGLDDSDKSEREEMLRTTFVTDAYYELTAYAFDDRG